MAAAARLFDLEQCPGNGPMPSSICQIPQVVPHVGGIILGKGSPDVNINGRPAARCGDRTICAGGGAIDIIVTGPKDVFINGRLAAAGGSKIDHKAVVITGSADVNYGDEMDGATLGDSKAATDACYEAARKRNFDQQQGKPMNCGQESVRQICLQRCKEQHNRGKACDACWKREKNAKGRLERDYVSEDEWYQRFLDDFDMAQQDETALRAHNEKQWRKLKSRPYYYKQSREIPMSGRSTRPQNYPNTGETRTRKKSTARTKKAINGSGSSARISATRPSERRERLDRLLSNSRPC